MATPGRRPAPTRPSRRWPPACRLYSRRRRSTSPRSPSASPLPGSWPSPARWVCSTPTAGSRRTAWAGTVWPARPSPRSHRARCARPDPPGEAVMSHRDPRDTTVDQQRVRRTRTGLISSDPERAFPGLTLFTPMFGDGTVYLVDLRGEVQHTWRLPYPPGLHGYLLDNGRLL